jgi:hypothetical protein
MQADAEVRRINVQLFCDLRLRLKFVSGDDVKVSPHGIQLTGVTRRQCFLNGGYLPRPTLSLAPR